MSKKRIIIFIVALVLLAAGTFLAKKYNAGGELKNLMGFESSRPEETEKQSEPEKIPKPPARPGANTTGLPLNLPPGFSISTFSSNLSGARVMAFDKAGNLWISRTGPGIITLIRIKNSQADSREDIFRNLRKPHGLAFDPADPDILYIAEENKISKVNVGEKIMEKSTGIKNSLEMEKIADLPAGGRHTTRTLIFISDGRLLVSIGSSCDVCHETDKRRAAIYALDKDGGNFSEYARGLRNAVFMTLNPVSNEIWATEMGRDYLGDNLPPDEINKINEGANYGWPVCYGKNIHDTIFDKNTYVRNPCSEPSAESSLVDLPAHSAPLGLAFLPVGEAGWPEELAGRLAVAYHGSWNRTQKTGYKIVTVKFGLDGPVIEDFITGWLTAGGNTLGRPADLKIGPDDRLYISDDSRGVIYRLEASNGLAGLYVKSLRLFR